jgi:hypothetical protein
MRDNNAACRSGSPGRPATVSGRGRREVRPKRRPRGRLVVADVDPTMHRRRRGAQQGGVGFNKRWRIDLQWPSRQTTTTNPTAF